MPKEAMFYNKAKDNYVDCFLCNHLCHIADRKFGVCQVRKNKAGMLYSLVYAKIIAEQIDPIEKKPLFHFYPGSGAYSIATVGCNFQCGFCQNWQISQYYKENKGGIPGKETLPETVVESALQQGCKSIAYTYTEPTIFFEYAYDVAKAARQKGLANVFVTNGFMTKEAIETIQPFLGAANIDLKSFRESFYSRVCKAKLRPVLESIKLMKKLGIWVEITTLVIPGQNDSKDELNDIAQFIAGLDKNMPWHISRFHPDYEFKGSGATPVETLLLAKEIGQRNGLRHIYVGNVFSEGLENTYCWSCKKLLIKRAGFQILGNKISNSQCPYCFANINGVW